MKKYNIPYKWYKTSLIVMWIVALITISGSWLTWYIAPALAWGIITNILLIIVMAAAVTMSFLHVRLDLRKRGIWLAVLLGLQTLFFILVCALGFTGAIAGKVNDAAVPAIHTVILLGIAAFGIYFTNRAKLTFKTTPDGQEYRSAQDAASAFGPAQPEPAKPVEEPKPAKPAKDEKTGIVSL